MSLFRIYYSPVLLFALHVNSVKRLLLGFEISSESKLVIVSLRQVCRVTGAAVGHVGNLCFTLADIASNEDI